MPKKKEVAKLPPASSVPGVKPLLEETATRKARLATVRTAIRKDGKVDKYNPKYRAALKRLKRTQRKLRKGLLQLSPHIKPAEAPGAPAANPAPIAAAEATQG